ncbi:MAG: gluconate 2-dehydrogenase subunit 3 family protein [Cyclobacteriaceae bacterium]
MERREALKLVGVITGATVVGSQAFLSSCTESREPLEGILSWNQIDLLEQIAEVILPKTEKTPGAIDAKVGLLANNIATDFYIPNDQKALTNELTRFEEAKFMKMTVEEKNAFVQQTEIEAGKNKKTTLILESGESVETTHPYIMIKQLSILGYLCSEVVATTNYNFLPIPGKYDKCVEVIEGVKPMYGNPSYGRSWGQAGRLPG